MCFNKVEGPKTLKRHTLVKNNMTQITGDFIKKIREIFKESEKLYETEEKIKLQTQNSATSLAELFIEQIDNEMLRDKKREKQRGIALKDAGTEEAYEENLELYEQLTGSLIMQNPDRAETISQNTAYLQRFVKGISICKKDERANNGGGTEPHTINILKKIFLQKLDTNRLARRT